MQKESANEGLLPALRFPAFRWLWSCNFISHIGTWVQNVALLLWVQDKYGKPGALGVVNLFSYLPVILFFLHAGTLVDVVDRRWILIYAQTLMALAAFALALEVGLGFANLFTVSLTVFILGLGFTVSFPGFHAITFDIVESRYILNAVSLNAAAQNTSRFLGPLLASLIVSRWGFKGGFYANSLSFLPIIVALMVIRVPSSQGRRAPGAFSFRQVAGGISYVFREGWARNLLITLGTMNIFALPYLVFLPNFGKVVLRAGDQGVYLLYAASGLGAVMGVPVVGLLHRRFEEREIVKIASVAIPASIIAFSLSPYLWLSMLCLFIAGVAFLANFSAINSLLQLKVEPRLRGRILSLFFFMLTGVAPIGGLIIGFLANRWGISGVLAGSSFLALIYGVSLSVFPGILAQAVVSQPSGAGKGRVSP